MLSTALIFLALVGKIKSDYFLMSINSTRGVTNTIINYDKATDLYYPVKFSQLLSYLINQNIKLIFKQKCDLNLTVISHLKDKKISCSTTKYCCFTEGLGSCCSINGIDLYLKISKLIEWILVILVVNILYVTLKKLWFNYKKYKINKRNEDVPANETTNEPESKKLLRAPIYVKTLPEGTTKEVYEKNYKKVLGK